MTTYRSIVDQLRYSGYGVPVGLPRGKWNACGRYDSLGRRQLVTQYDDATVGVPDTVVDEVKFTYEDWGNVSKFEQDHNSAVGASGSIDDYEVRYTYAKATAGRNTIRRTKLEHLYVSTVKKTILFD